MSTKDLARILDLLMTEDQFRACAYLEARGLTFCVEFGYDNCVEMARAHWLQRRRDLYRDRIAVKKRAH